MNPRFSFLRIGIFSFWMACAPALQKKDPALPSSSPPSSQILASQTLSISAVKPKENQRDQEGQKQAKFPFSKTTQAPENLDNQTRNLQKLTDEEKEAILFVETKWKKIFEIPMSKEKREHLCLESLNIDEIPRYADTLVMGRTNWSYLQKLNANQKKLSLLLCILFQQREESRQKTKN